MRSRYSIHCLLLLFFPLCLFAEERVPWTTNNVKGSPEPALPYTTEVIWPHIAFDEAVDITFLESEGRMFISERLGKIYTLPADLTASPKQATLVVDLKSVKPRLGNLLGLAFHPEFKSNREIFIHHTLRPSGDNRDIRISRYRMDKNFSIIPESEEELYTIPGSGHTGGDVQFGPDGMLYFTIGDLAPPSPPDPNNAGQDMTTLSGKISRIDVNGKDPGLSYRIPKDNPFVNQDNIRPEIWAYGFRNPWKISFHPKNGEVWVGDVGWEIWEMVYRVVPGGNYGWSIMEGPAPLKVDQPMGPSNIIAPTAFYSHIEGASVTGGYFVTNARLPKLQGSYVYGDYVTGRAWALDWNGTVATNNRLIADTRKQIVSFGQTLDGDLIFLNYPDNCQVHRLIPNPVAAKKENNSFPQKLSDTGLFANVTNETASPGVYPFKINAPYWQDGYDSRYWVGIPGNGYIEPEINLRNNLPLLRYYKPTNTVLAKTIHKDGQRIETQILHFDGYWNGYSYRWNDEQTEATLVQKEGLDTTIKGKPYHFPARSECVRCHGSNFHRPLAFLPGQLDRDGQLDRFLDLGLINQEFKDFAASQPLTHPEDETASLNDRARSWIHVNCAYCHRVSGGAGVTSAMNRAVPNVKTGLLNGLPEKGALGLDDGHLIKPGNP